MKGITYEKLETLAEKTGDWCDQRIRQAKAAAYAYSERHRGSKIGDAVRTLLSRKRAPRLIMRRTCIGCKPEYWEG